MDFYSKEEARRAVVAVLLHVPPMIGAFEDCVIDAGFEILSRHHEDGVLVPSPVLRLRREGRELEAHLGNAIEDFLFVDRDAEPVRVDPEIGDDDYAARKAESIVNERIELLEVVLAPEGEEKERRLRDLSHRFEWIRITRIGGES